MSFGFGLGFNLSGIGAYDPEEAVYSLFTNNEQGVWYDPSDLSTMYQDSGGITASVVNQPVGLVLDKSRWDERGVVNLITNSNNFALWNLTNVTVTPNAIAGPGDVGLMDTLTDNTATGYHNAHAVVNVLDGAVFARSMIVKRGTARYVAFGVANTFSSISNTWIFDFDTGSFVSIGSNGAGQSIEALGSDTYRITLLNVSSSSFNCRITVGLSSDATVGSTNYTGGTPLTVHLAKAQFERGAAFTEYQETGTVVGGPGNHATQATTASKPILRGTPAGANLVTNGTFDTDTDWTKGSGWTISAGAAHFATTGAASNLSQNIGLVTSRSYRTQITVTVSAGSLSVYTGAGGGGLARTITASGTYDIFSGAGADANLYLQASTTFSGSVDNVEVHDASADAVQAPYWLSFDGVDDFLSTAAINFTGTDKMTVVAGARKNSDSAAGVIAELSVAATANNGTFLIDAPDVPAEQDYGFYARGSSTVAVAANGFPAPETAVLTLQVDTGAASNRAIARRNGVQLGTSGAAAIGAVNFGSYPLYIGRRAGTSLPFNGRLHQLIVRGAQTDAAKLAKAEAFTATKTGVSL